MNLDARTAVAAGLALAAAIGLSLRGPFLHGVISMPEVTLQGQSYPEGCLRCHPQLRGLGLAHDPSAIGCSPCHLGDPAALDRDAAHAGMVLLSGDLATAEKTCGRSGCHPSELQRVDKSMMAGAPGILAVDRFVFGERSTPAGTPADDLRRLDPSTPAGSPAESHVRKLCASCHLGAPKSRPGDLGFDARGGGCTACHLAPPAVMHSDGPVHPNVSAAVSETRCEGCHARSGRISLSYHGKAEIEPNDPRKSSVLPDGRPIAAAPADVHAKVGMTCLDCHTERCIMGDGVAHQHAEEAVDVSCEDCHQPQKNPAATSADQARVADILRSAWGKRARSGLSSTPLRTKSGTPLWRTDSATSSQSLIATGETTHIPLVERRAYHTLRGHDRLTCQACHSVWAPRCTSCHSSWQPEGTQFDHLSGHETAGEWREDAGGNGFGLPVLALGASGKIVPCVEGMTLRIDGLPKPVEGRFWAPLDPHTTGKSRSCVSCHGSEAEGTMPKEGVLTRVGGRLLSEEERARVLTVGRCLPCHGDYDDLVYQEFGASLARLQSRSPGDRAALKCRER